MPTQLLQISYSLSNIENAAHQFWQCAHQYRVLAFNGDLGAGKTTFIHAICKMLGVNDAVSSPTFALINEYHFDNNDQDTIIYHMDWYRLKDVEEAINAGVEDYLLQPGHYSFIEWPGRVEELLPYPYLLINIKSTGNTTRSMTIDLIVS